MIPPPRRGKRADSRLLGIGLGALAGLLLVLCVAHHLSAPEAGDGAPPAEGQPARLPPRSSAAVAEGSHASVSRPAAAPSSRAAGARAAIHDLANSYPKEDVAAKMAALLPRLTPADYPILARELAGIPIEAEPDAVWELLLPAWARINGEEAFTFALATPNAKRVALEAMDAWITAAPPAPVAWLKSIADPQKRAYHAQLYVGCFLRRDPQEAIALAPTFDDPIIRAAAWRQIASVAAESPDPDRRAAVAQALLEHASDEAAADAAGRLVSDWAQDDAASAVRWATSLPPGPMRRTAFRDWIGNWAGADPAAAAGWLDQDIHSPEWESAIAAYALVTASRSPETARQWASTIADPKLQRETLERLQSQPR